MDDAHACNAILYYDEIGTCIYMYMYITVIDKDIVHMYTYCMCLS